MRRWILIVVFILPFTGFAQESHSNGDLHDRVWINTERYLNLFLQTDGEDSSDEIVSLIKKLENKKNTFRNDRDFLSYLFTKTHQKLLKRYTEYCSFSALLNSGTYNCLTGTALYAIMLSHFNIDYDIIETNYHIFLIAKTLKGDILFEATDPLKGFVESSKEIEKRINIYRANEIKASNGDKKNYRYNFNLYNKVNIEQLLGLLYYNYSIESYNQNHFIASIYFLDRATRYYNSERLEEFSKIILLTLIERKVDTTEKEVCLKKIQSIRKKMPVLASRN